MTDKQLIEAVEKHRVEFTERSKSEKEELLTAARKINGKGHNTDKERLVLQRRIRLQRAELRRLNRRIYVQKLLIENSKLRIHEVQSGAYRQAANIAEEMPIRGSHRIADAIRKWI